MISCLLVTANNRLKYFKKSLQCFNQQTYPNKQLLIVNEGSREYQTQIVAECRNFDNVRFVFLDGKYTLGALRNIAIALCDGDIFVQWDDDDFNAPERLFAQFSQLNKTGARVSYLTEQLHYYFPLNEIYLESWSRFGNGDCLKYSLIPGTIMAYKSGFNYRYPVSGVFCTAGEDSVLLCDVCENEPNILSIPYFGHLNVYSFHGQNVWGLEHHQKISMQRAVVISEVLSRKKEICRTIDSVGLSKPIRVMGRDGLAFNYTG